MEKRKRLCGICPYKTNAKRIGLEQIQKFYATDPPICLKSPNSICAGASLKKPNGQPIFTKQQSIKYHEYQQSN